MGAVCEVRGPNNSFEIGTDRPLAIIAGPCALESRELGLQIGEVVRDACDGLGLPYVFKASYDKANRTSLGSSRGPGMERGLEDLAAIRASLGVPVTTDVHAPEQAGPVAEVIDVLQVPAFLCRQTDLLLACGEAARAHGRCVNIKKGQFLSPSEMVGPVEKVRSTGARDVLVTERGTFFGYHRLVNDFIGVGDLLEAGHAPVVFDATHSVQLPGASATTGGRRDRVPMLARAAVAAGVDAVFLECHPDPDSAASDRETMLRLEDVPALLSELAAIRRVLSDSGSVLSGRNGTR
ncbi:MAG: 3-deoxy-8-phosphooctulonate synthase [Planctomycetota bacterium]